MLYQHLTHDERVKIHTLLKERLSIRQIAQKLNRNVSTISREIKRNPWDACKIEYNFNCADRKYKERRTLANQQKKKKMQDEQILAYTKSHLALGWSPEQIAGRISIDLPGRKVSYETIYQFIYQSGGELVKQLPRKRPKRQKRGSVNNTRYLAIPNRISIDERPEVINRRMELWHWESDTLVSKQSSVVLNAMVERKSGLLKLSKMSCNTAANTKDTIIEKMFGLTVKSITYDNGSENMEHLAINKVLGCKSYFCHPYHSWEKGSVENTNGLIRRFLPKKTDFSKISLEQLSMIEKLINERPRKRHRFMTPSEVLFSGRCTSG